MKSLFYPLATFGILRLNLERKWGKGRPTNLKTWCVSGTFCHFGTQDVNITRKPQKSVAGVVMAILNTVHFSIS